MQSLGRIAGQKWVLNDLFIGLIIIFSIFEGIQGPRVKIYAKADAEMTVAWFESVNAEIIIMIILLFLLSTTDQHPHVCSPLKSPRTILRSPIMLHKTLTQFQNEYANHEVDNAREPIV
jgi:LytS/YehU family sensor histidine kinase